MLTVCCRFPQPRARLVRTGLARSLSGLLLARRRATRREGKEAARLSGSPGQEHLHQGSCGIGGDVTQADAREQMPRGLDSS